jgi:hypothetical protein
LFLALKIAFKTASIYAPDHPAFLKGADDLQSKLEVLLSQNPLLTIKFTPRALYVDAIFWDKDRLAADLSRLFHLRKIRSLKFLAGITPSEIRTFTALITRTVEELIHQGGLLSILKKENFAHITAEELDYTELLAGEGEEIRDLWPYLLMEAAEAEDPAKLALCAKRLQEGQAPLDTETILASDDVQKSLLKLLRYIKETGPEREQACAKNLVKSLVAGTKVPSGEKLEKLRRLVNEIRPEDLASTLWEEVVADPGFNATGLGIFSQIVSRNRQPGVSSALQGLFQSDNPANRRPETREKILALLSETSGPYVSTIYRRTLSDLLRNMTFEEKQTFDQAGMERHFRYLLLNILDRDNDPEPFLWTLDQIGKEWSRIAEAKDSGFLRDYLTVLRDKESTMSEHPAYRSSLITLLLYLEDLILEGFEEPEFEEILPRMKDSARGSEVILDRIFEARIATPTLIRFYFRMFSDNLGPLKERIQLRAADEALLKSFAGVLAAIDSRTSFETLKLLYQAGGPEVKLKVLISLGSMTEFDEAFLFSVLRSDDLRLRAEAIVLLGRTDRTRHVAFKRLFAAESPFGFKNRSILRDLRIVEERNLRNAEPYVRGLLGRSGFWNKRLRQTAERLLEAWHEG